MTGFSLGSAVEALVGYQGEGRWVKAGYFSLLFLSRAAILEVVAFPPFCPMAPDPKQPPSSWVHFLPCRPGSLNSSSNTFLGPSDLSSGIGPDVANLSGFLDVPTPSEIVLHMSSCPWTMWLNFPGWTRYRYERGMLFLISILLIQWGLGRSGRPMHVFSLPSWIREYIHFKAFGTHCQITY